MYYLHSWWNPQLTPKFQAISPSRSSRSSPELHVRSKMPTFPSHSTISHVLIIVYDHYTTNYGTTVDGRNIQTPSIRYNPLAPKVQCYCNLKCVSPNGRKKIKPLTSLLLTRALKHWDLGVRGVQHSACYRVWIFCPSTVSFSDVFTSFGLQTLLWKHQCACCWSSSKVRKTLAFHK